MIASSVPGSPETSPEDPVTQLRSAVDLDNDCSDLVVVVAARAGWEIPEHRLYGVDGRALQEAVNSYGRRVSESSDLLVIGTSETDTAHVMKAGELGVPVIVELDFWLGEL